MWRRQQFSTPDEAYDPGPATVTARLRVTDIATGAPGTPGVQTKQIYVRPGAKIELPATATLGPNGAVRLVLRARCDKPWVLAEFGLSASQGEFPNQANWSTVSDTYPTCDSSLPHEDLRDVGDAGAPQGLAAGGRLHPHAGPGGVRPGAEHDCDAHVKVQ